MRASATGQDATRAGTARPTAGNGSDDAIRTEGLHKIYAGDVPAVDRLDLAVRQGEVFALLGPNGAGKTTTVGMLTTRVVPTGGRATVAGIDVAAEPARAKQRMGVVSQHNSLDRSLTTWQNLYFHARYFGMGASAARAAADEWLEAFRLEQKARATVDTLSGGMARRLMLARALLHRPDVVFLDEPTAGLDPQSRWAMWEMVARLRKGGQTVFLTTHYMEEADEFCDRVAIMDHGRILALDTPANLKRTLGAGVTVSVRADGDLDRLAAHLRRVDGAQGARRVDDAVRVDLASADGALVRVLAAASDGGFRVTDLTVTEATLEAVFLSLTGTGLRE